MKKIILLLSVGSLAASFSLEAQVTVNPLVDTYIRESAPDTNNSGSASLLIGHTINSGDEFNGLFKFDLNIPALVGQTIQSVTLEFTKNANGSSVGSSTIQIFETIPDWNSTQADWNGPSNIALWNTPGAEGAGTDYDTTLLASFTGSEASISTGSKITFSSESAFVSLVQSNIGSVINLLAIVPDSNDRTVWNVGTNENANSSYYTTLTITAVPEPSTYALLGGLMALGLVMVRRRQRL